MNNPRPPYPLPDSADLLRPQPRARRRAVSSQRGPACSFPVHRSGFLRVIAVAASLAIATGPVVAQTAIVGWGSQVFNIPCGTASCVQVAAGGGHTVTLRSDGSVVAWGNNLSGQTDVPALPPGLTYTQVAAGWEHTVALRNDGSVVAWGSNSVGQTDVPALPPGLAYTKVAAGVWHSVALRSDGSVVTWGDNSFSQYNAPALPPGLTYVQLAAGGGHTVGRRSDGSVVMWGWPSHAIQSPVPPLPVGRVYTDVAAGSTHTVALRSDGEIVGWGWNSQGQLAFPILPPGLTYVQVSAGNSYTVALRSDGAVVAWGFNGNGQINVPALPAGVAYAQVAAGGGHTVALVIGPALPQVSVVGSGCPGSSGATTLSNAQLPFLGNAGFSLDVSQAAPSSHAYLFLATAAAATPLAVGGGCFVYLDAQSLLAFLSSGLSPFGPVLTTAFGTAHFPMPVLPDPMLAGLEVLFQAAILDAAAPLGITLSNGLNCLLN